MAFLTAFGKQKEDDLPAKADPQLGGEGTQLPIAWSLHQSHNRAGKFELLSGFVKQDGSKPEPDYRSYKTITADAPAPGDVIHIIDGGNTRQSPTLRLHERVMLVIRLESLLAMTCVPLCRHNMSLPETEEKHWKVQQEDQPRDTISSGLVPEGRPLLEIKLLKEGHTLEHGITVNLTELWHVECEQLWIDKLGFTKRESWLTLLDKVKDLFCQSLDACKPLPGNVETRSQQNVSQQGSQLEQPCQPETSRESRNGDMKAERNPHRARKHRRGRARHHEPSKVLCSIL